MGIAACILIACGERREDHYREFHALGTVVSLSLYSVDTSTANAAFAAIEADYSTFGRDWYPWQPGELQRVNAAIDAGQAVTVSAALAEAIRCAAHFEAESRGRFDAGLGHLSELWGLQPAFESPLALPDPARIAAAVQANGGATGLRWQGNELSADGPGTMLDLGGIAKGILLQRTVDELGERGIGDAIVNLGGDLMVIGQAHGRRAARIGIRAPSGGEALAGIVVQSGEAVLSSGNYERYVTIDGRRYTHIIDPATGYPVEQSAAVTVVSKDPVQADAAATALMVGGPAEFDRIVAWMGLQHALLIAANGDLRLTPAMRERLGWQNSVPDQ